RARKFALILGSLLTGIAATAAAEDLTVPADPVEKTVFDVLEKSCARCHQEGRLVSRERPSKNFGNVLKLSEIASNPNLVLPGNPYGSKLFKQIVDKEMPYDVMYEGAAAASPSAEDLKVLEAWIESLGAKTASACEAHKFIDNREI